MLKLIVSVLLASGFCACTKYHPYANFEYLNAVENGHEKLPYQDLSNEASPQQVKLTRIGLLVLSCIIQDEQAKGKISFRISNELFTLSELTFSLHDQRLELYFASPWRTIVIQSMVFNRPVSGDLLLDAEENAVHVKLSLNKKLKKRAIATSRSMVNEIKTTFSFAWIKDLFTKWVPVRKDKLLPSSLSNSYIGPALTIDDNVIEKLTQMTLHLKNLGDLEGSTSAR